MIIEEMTFIEVTGQTRKLTDIIGGIENRLLNMYFRDFTNVNDIYGYSEVSAQVANAGIMQFEKERDIDNHIRGNFIRYSGGSALEELGARVGVYREEGAFATDYVTLTLPNAPDELYTVSAGFECSTRDNIIFESTEDVMVNIGETEVNIPVRCIEIGSIGNVLEGTITNILTTLEFEATVRNGSDFTNGIDIEDDESYKESIMESPNNYRVGTSAWFETIAKKEVKICYYDNDTNTLFYKPVDGNSADKLQTIFSLKQYQTPFNLFFNEASPQVVIKEDTHLITVYYDKNYELDSIIKQIRQNISDFVDKIVLGGRFEPNCMSFLAQVDGVREVSLEGYEFILLDNTHYPIIEGEIQIKGIPITI